MLLIDVHHVYNLISNLLLLSNKKIELMKKIIFRKIIIIWILLFSSYKGISQSNPTPYNLETGGTYNFTNWPSTSVAGTYPNNMVFHILANTNPTLASSSSGNVTGVYNDAGTTTRMNGLGTGGFSFRNSSAIPDITGYTLNRLGEAVLGLNTSNRTSIKVSFKSGEIGSTSAIYAITCQYRIGTSGAYLSLPGASGLWEYRSDNASSSVSFAPVTLPSTCCNQSVVQIRWAYNYISGASTLKPQLFVDDISVSSIPLVLISPLPNTCSYAPPFLLTDGQPVGGVYSGVGVVGSNFDPAVAGSGIQTITYTYTDANGFSNFASTTIDVNSSYCITTTSLTPVSCGATGLSLNSIIYCETVYGATDYEFQFVNGGLGFTQSRTRGIGAANLQLTAVTGLQYGQTYDVKVRAKVSGVWGAYSILCQITLMPFPPTQLSSSYCGVSGLSLSSAIYCDAVPGAGDYEFTLSNSLGYNQTKNRGIGSPNINLIAFTGLNYGQTYDVNVRAKVSGVWGPVGSVCQLTLMSFPATQLSSISCGASGLSISSIIYCNSISGGSDYEFTISNSSGYNQVKNRGLGNPNIGLIAFSGLNYGQTYDVTVKAKVSGVWGPVGPVCQITLMAFPATQLSTVSCGASGLFMSSTIYCNAISGASDYEFTISNGSGYNQVKNRGIGNPNIGLSAFSGLTGGQTYDVTVKAKVGGVWGPLGPICQITLSSTPGLLSQNSEELKQMEFSEGKSTNPIVKIYPNPITKDNELTIELTKDQSVIVIISDIAGRRVYEKNYMDINLIKIPISELHTDDGLYILSLINGSNVYNEEVVISK